MKFFLNFGFVFFIIILMFITDIPLFIKQILLIIKSFYLNLLNKSK